MNLALVADWITTAGGAERALAELHAIWPSAPLFTTVARKNVHENLRAADIRTTRLQFLYRLLGKHQILLPLMPRVVEEIDLRGYDVILSSSHAVGKGIIPPSNAVHVCYCHTPMRYAWEMENQYLDDFGIPKFFRKTVKRYLMNLRRWDLASAKRVDTFIANSLETAARIERIYGRTSVVIPPPVHDRFFRTPLIPTMERSSYLAVGRFVPYKRFDLLIECANALQLPLTIVGGGYEEKRLRAMAGPTVTFRGRVSDDDLPSLYASAKAVLFPAHEDAGIVPLEAQACGTPVIALGKGGTKDTVVEGKTGLFFDAQTAASLQAALKKFSTMHFDSAEIREHARQFSSGKFRERIKDEVEKAVVRYGREARS
ncbi:MAG: glycosyltransferase [Candidatus Peribacteraceae bacterium]|nr:glycosyltransferase [Candidatus Peribacteraceae bacterium]